MFGLLLEGSIYCYCVYFCRDEATLLYLKAMSTLATAGIDTVIIKPYIEYVSHKHACRPSLLCRSHYKCCYSRTLLALFVSDAYLLLKFCSLRLLFQFLFFVSLIFIISFHSLHRLFHSSKRCCKSAAIISRRTRTWQSGPQCIALLLFSALLYL